MTCWQARSSWQRGPEPQGRNEARRKWDRNREPRVGVVSYDKPLELSVQRCHGPRQHWPAAQRQVVQATTMNIRKATIDDVDILAELCLEVQRLHVKLQPLIFREPSHRELVDIFRERISDPDYFSFLALDKEIPVGYIAMHIFRKPENVFAFARDVLEIDHIHINQKYCRQGICRQLFAKAPEVARAFDIENIQLGVWAQNDRAISAFNALGFKQQYHIMALEDRSKL